jgi:hypothetical protein
LVPQLTTDRHEVVAFSRSALRARVIAESEAATALGDALRAEDVNRAVTAAGRTPS